MSYTVEYIYNFDPLENYTNIYTDGSVEDTVTTGGAEVDIQHERGSKKSNLPCQRPAIQQLQSRSRGLQDIEQLA